MTNHKDVEFTNAPMRVHVVTPVDGGVTTVEPSSIKFLPYGVKVETPAEPSNPDAGVVRMFIPYTNISHIEQVVLNSGEINQGQSGHVHAGGNGRS